MKMLFKYLSEYKSRMTVGFIIKSVGTLSELFIPYLLTYILESVIITKRIDKIIYYGMLMVVCAVIASLGNIIANRMAARVTKDFSRNMRIDLFSKTLQLSARDIDDFTIPSLESRITTDTYNVQNFVGMMQRMGVRAPILLVGGTIVTLFMDKALALVMIATMPLIFIMVYTISKKGVPLYTNVQKSVDSMVRVVREDVQGIRVIKALSKNDYENRRYDVVNCDLTKKESRAGIVMSAVNPFMTLLMNLGIAGVVALAAVRVANGTSSTASVIAFMQYFTLISMSMMALSRMFVMYTKCAASAKRISEVINIPDSFFVIEDNSGCDSENYISFQNVCFSYLGKKDNLNDISFSIRKGSSLGIIGATGSGKSTLVRLLLRFYEADSGVIKINGRNITSYSKEELTALFGVALQNDFIYADTIKENICFGREISEEAMIKAAKTAQAHDFIMSFKDGYNYKLSAKGTNISGGQRQRLLIARAVAANPQILIFDDSSSALDYKTDANLRSAVAKQMQGSTVITVAQRVSSVKSCDLIIVLDEGKIIGKGTHEYLIENCSEYREISDSQMGGAFID